MIKILFRIQSILLGLFLICMLGYLDKAFGEDFTMTFDQGSSGTYLKGSDLTFTATFDDPSDEEYLYDDPTYSSSISGPETDSNNTNSITHTFNTVGDYTVTITATGSIWEYNEDTDAYDIYVDDYTATATADITVDPVTVTIDSIDPVYLAKGKGKSADVNFTIASDDDTYIPSSVSMTATKGAWSFTWDLTESEYVGSHTVNLIEGTDLPEVGNYSITITVDDTYTSSPEQVTVFEAGFTSLDYVPKAGTGTVSVTINPTGATPSLTIESSNTALAGVSPATSTGTDTLTVTGISESGAIDDTSIKIKYDDDQLSEEKFTVFKVGLSTFKYVAKGGTGTTTFSIVPAAATPSLAIESSNTAKFGVSPTTATGTQTLTVTGISTSSSVDDVAINVKYSDMKFYDKKFSVVDLLVKPDQNALYSDGVRTCTVLFTVVPAVDQVDINISVSNIENPTETAGTIATLATTNTLGIASKIYTSATDTCTAKISTYLSNSSNIKTTDIYNYDVYDIHDISDTASSYNDTAFTTISMTVAQIQTFLEDNHSCLATFYVGIWPFGKYASTIIHDAAVSKGVNPKVILTALQTEKGLISKTGTLDPNSVEARYAMMNGSISNFTDQINGGTQTFLTGYNQFSSFPVLRENIRITDQTAMDRYFNIDNRSTSTQFRYNPVLSGRALYMQLWEQYGF